jgi:3-deoxy-7-phosphoheptulonate synthase
MVPSPSELKSLIPASSEDLCFIQKSRSLTKRILEKKEKKLAILVGPCSIHNEESALEYAQKLWTLSKKLRTLFPIMRVFLEKPRTLTGWKGILYDPDLNGSFAIKKGLFLSRKILLGINRIGIPCASELLDPITVPYFADLLSWGLIGARTSSSQIHRQIASQMEFPIGFKNDLHGEMDGAIHSILSSRLPHQRIGINEEGRVATFFTKGNPWSHLVLRGSLQKTNYEKPYVEQATNAMKAHHLNPLICMDCSHGNSQKNHKLQRIAFENTIQQRAKGNQNIISVMLESYLYPGKQPLKDSKALEYGVSITDACIGWEETQELILSAEETLSSSSKEDPTSINFVQK